MATWVILMFRLVSLKETSFNFVSLNLKKHLQNALRVFFFMPGHGSGCRYALQTMPLVSGGNRGEIPANSMQGKGLWRGFEGRNQKGGDGADSDLSRQHYPV